MEPVYAEVLVGRAEVKEIFSSRKVGKVAGVRVVQGKVLRDAQAKLLRQGEIVHESRVSSLKHFKDDVAEVAAGLECGIGLDGSVDFHQGDIIEIYRKERVS